MRPFVVALREDDRYMRVSGESTCAGLHPIQVSAAIADNRRLAFHYSVIKANSPIGLDQRF
jgi:hypothetical protein